MINIIKILILNLVLCSTVYASNYTCTGFFISSDGYIGTAAHCLGTQMYGAIEKAGLIYTLPLKVVAVDKTNDSMLLKMDINNVAYYALSLNPTFTDENIAYIGYPNPDVYGWYKHTSHGLIKYVAGIDNVVIAGSRNMIVSSIWSRPGTSGSCVYDSNSSCIGILTEGFSLFNITAYTGIRPIQALVKMALVFYVHIVLSNATNTSISDAKMQDLFLVNKDKTILIFGTAVGGE